MSPGMTSMSVALILSGAMSLAAIGVQPPAPEQQPPVEAGQLVWTSDVHSFRTCGDDAKNYWIVASDQIRMALRDGYAGLMQAPDEPIWIIAETEPAGRPAGEPAAQFDGAVRIVRIQTLVPYRGQCGDAPD